MRLNLEIIRTYLPEEYTYKSHGVDGKTLLFRRPFLYVPGMELTSGNLYIIALRDLIALSPVAGIGIICIGNRIPSSWTASGTQILAVSEEIGLAKLFNLINSIYDYFDDWDEQLRDELEKEVDFDIRKILLLGSELLKNPISICGETLQTLFVTKYCASHDEQDHFWDVDTPCSMNSSHVERIRLVCDLERTITVPFLSSVDLPNQKSYCKNLYSMGYFVGCVSITTFYRPFLESDFPLADHFFSCVQKAFLKYLRNNTQSQSPGATALQKLLRHEPLNDDEHSLFQLSPNESWIFFKVREKRGKRYLPREYMYGTLNALMAQNVYVAMYHKEIVGLIRLQEDEDKELEPFASLLKRMEYFAGLSNTFYTIERIGEFLLQAHYVVEQSHPQSNEESLYYFRDYALDYFLYACTAEMSPEALISRKLYNLVEYDRKKGTEYVKTLDIFLQNEMNITKTSDALFIHRTSLVKRLDKLKRLLNDDLCDSNRRLFYRICLALLK